MAISNFEREQITLLMGGSTGTPNIGAGYMSLGSASGTITVNTTGLLNNFVGVSFTGGSVDLSTPQVIGMQADFNSVQLSGLTLRQMGIFTGSGLKAWEVENTVPTTFNGTQELQVIFYQQIF